MNSDPNQRPTRPVQPPFRPTAAARSGSTEDWRMALLRRLQNPFALVAQGFVLGGILFFATHPASLQARASDAASASLAAEARR